MATAYYYISSGTKNLKSPTSNGYYVYGSGRLIISSGGTTPEVHVGKNGPAAAYGGYVEVLAHGLILNSWSILSAVDTSAWTLAGVADFNADGTDDIAWCNNETGLAGYWQINDKQLTTWSNIANLA